MSFKNSLLQLSFVWTPVTIPLLCVVKITRSDLQCFAYKNLLSLPFPALGFLDRKRLVKGDKDSSVLSLVSH